MPNRLGIDGNQPLAQVFQPRRVKIPVGRGSVHAFGFRWRFRGGKKCAFNAFSRDVFSRKSASMKGERKTTMCRETIATVFAKRENAEELVKFYFEPSFGARSKSDIDLMMFKIYYAGLNGKGALDIEISRDLKITQAKVRSLKNRLRLVYPQESGEDLGHYLEELFATTKYIHYNEKSDKIEITVLDSILYENLKDCLEEDGACLDITLNPKLFSITAEQFIDFALDKMNVGQKKEIQEQLKTQGLKTGRGVIGKDALKSFLTSIVRWGISTGVDGLSRRLLNQLG